ncbi:MAG TPA: O-antigen ligase family protein [Vicinamibacterales bacterium]|nr:O-antigen ligase family protein [Vicinamibacterales bacterium]
MAAAGLVVWALLAMAGAYRWSAVPLWLGALALTAIRRPRLFPPEGFLLDAGLVALLAGVAIQLLPIGAAVRDLIDPHAAPLLARLLVGAPPQAGRTLSIAPAATAWALFGLAGVFALFWTCRSLLAARGVRVMARTIAGAGLFVSVVAIVQRTSSIHRIYGIWRPDTASAQPFGPFVNRDHFATWMLMAIPLTLGYLMAHGEARGKDASRTPSLAARLTGVLEDTTRLWLGGAAAAMTLALFGTLSRSGVLGLMAGVAAGGWFARSRLRPAARRRAGLWAAALVVLLGVWANLGVIFSRFRHTLSDSGHRLEIWRETLPIIRDFWLTGTGAGTYPTAMLVYQTSSRSVFFNQAHDHYLQVLAEGGLLLAVPAALALAGLAATARRALARDRTPLYWLRAGAAAGLCGVAVQSIWETGLRMPANAVLCAVLAAIVVHAPRMPGSGDPAAQRRNHLGTPRHHR